MGPVDPGVHHYYTAGLVLAVLLWEGVARPGRLPLLTVAAALVMELTPKDIHPSPLAGAMRLAFMAALVAAAFAVPRQRVAGSPPARRLSSRSHPWKGARSPASQRSRSPGVLRSQSGRASLDAARRSRHRSAIDGRPQNQ